MKIALYGIGGTYNYGCDAIVEGTERIIHAKYPNAILDYYSYDYENDAKRLKKIKINVIPVYKNGLIRFWSRVFSKVEVTLRRVNLIRDDYLTCWILFSWIKKYDYVLSIGGDIYTLPPVTERNTCKRYTNRLLEIDKYCTRKKIPNVVWGASIGPFEESIEFKKVFIGHLSSFVRFFCVREENTYKYLVDNSINRVSLYADPAFALTDRLAIEDVAKSLKNQKLTIGINLSPLATGYSVEESEGKKRKEKQIESLMAIQKKYGCHIILIPHVYSKYSKDNDYEYLNALILEMPQSVKSFFSLARTDSFLDTKHEIEKCDLCIAARMHCAVNSITSGVPAIFLSYSEKSIGMCKMVYGNDDYVIDIANFENYSLVIEKIDTILNKYSVIRADMISRVIELKASAYDSANVFDNSWT